MTVGDYDGTLTQLHLETGHFVSDRDENGGRRSAQSLCACLIHAPVLALKAQWL